MTVSLPRREFYFVETQSLNHTQVELLYQLRGRPYTNVQDEIHFSGSALRALRSERRAAEHLPLIFVWPKVVGRYSANFQLLS